ncbi:MAG: hypothetical protein PHW33_02620 [Candidatus Portnoybacteria bacterium]|jgi:ascorbate-specific PTS system EIIC-type component UlaA|nr:hypothetical protein [Candidatus Portnoybacteria bacterium]
MFKFFDRLEDKIRHLLSHHPLLYALIGSVGVILLWRGVWETADMFDFMTGPVSAIIGLILLLATGLFVSFFVGSQIIISGIKEQKKIEDKTEEEVKKEELDLREIKRDLEEIKRKLDQRG